MNAVLVNWSGNRSVNILIESLFVAIVLTAGSVGFATWMGWIAESLNPIEVFATFTSYSCTYMVVMQTRWNYPMAILSTASLSYVFWQADLLASAALNVYLIPTVIYGYFIWGKDKETRPVEHVKLSVVYQYALYTAAAYVGAWALVNYLGGAFAPLDSFLLIGSILGQFLLDRKKIETWLVWISVNIVSIYIYFESGLYLLAIQFMFFLLNAVFGYVQWNKTLKQQDV